MYRVLLLLVTLCSQAAAGESRLFVDLDYQLKVGENCPSEETFKTMVTDQLGYDPFRTQAQHRIVARAETVEHGMRGSVQWYDGSGSLRGGRELSSQSEGCAVFARAMSFAIAVQIQLLGREAEGTSQPDSDSASDREHALDPRAPTATENPRDGAHGGDEPGLGTVPRASVDLRAIEEDSSVPQRWHFLVGAGPALAFGVGPRTAVGGRLFAGARRDWLGLEIGAEASLPSEHVLADGSGFEQRFAFGSAAACLVVRSVSGCLVNKLGRLYVRGFGVDLPRATSGFVAQIGPRFAVSSPLAGRWIGALRIETLATLAPWAVTLNQRDVWKAPTLSASVGAELAVLLQ